MNSPGSRPGRGGNDRPDPHLKGLHEDRLSGLALGVGPEQAARQGPLGGPGVGVSVSVAVTAKSSWRVKPRSDSRTPRYSPWASLYWVLMSLSVVVSSSRSRAASSRRLGSGSGR